MSSKKNTLIGTGIAAAVAMALTGCCAPNPWNIYAHTPKYLTYVPVLNCPEAAGYLYNSCRVFSNSCKTMAKSGCTTTGCGSGTFVKAPLNCVPVAYVDP